MFEVIVTQRPDFRELSVGRYATDEEAQEVARRLTGENMTLIRAWVRVIREANSTR